MPASRKPITCRRRSSCAAAGSLRMSTCFMPPTWTDPTCLQDRPSRINNNRTRLLSGVAHAAFKLRAEVVERSFALILDRGGMRRAWLRGRETLPKRYLIHVAGYNLGLMMRLLTGSGTPRGFQDQVLASLAAITTPDGGLLVLLIVVAGDQTAAVAFSIAPDHLG